MPARLSHRWLLPALLALTGCSAGSSASPVPTPPPAATAVAASTPPTAASPAPATGRALAATAVFTGALPEHADIQAFVLGHPEQVIAAGGGNVVAAGGANVIAPGGANVIAPGGGNVVAPGGANVIAPQGGNYRLLATNDTRAEFALALPDAVAPGTPVRIVVTGGGQTLVGLAVAPEARRVASAEDDRAVVSAATTLAYLVLSKRLEGAGQAVVTEKGQLIQGLTSLVTDVYAQMTDSVRSALEAAPEDARLAALSAAMKTALEHPDAPGSLSSEGADALMSLAPRVGEAFSRAVGRLNTGIRDAVAQGARRPDAAYLGPISLGKRTSLGSVYTQTHHGGPPPAEAPTGVMVEDGTVQHPTGAPVLTTGTP